MAEPIVEPIADPIAHLTPERPPGNIWLIFAIGGVIGLLIGIVIALVMHRSSTSTETPMPQIVQNISAPAPPSPGAPGKIAAAPASQPTTELAYAPPPSSSTEDHLSAVPDQPPTPAPAVEPPPPPKKTAPSSPSASAPPRPPINPIPEPPAQLSDERIGQSITRGVNFLISAFDPNLRELRGSRSDNGAYFAGLDSLCVYALLQSGEATGDERLNVKSPFMSGLIDRMKQLPAATGPVTYARAIRATALALNNRPEDRAALKADMLYLIHAADHGAYTYDRSGMVMRRGPPGEWDNSNSQYGLLGVWSAAEAGQEVPSDYWREVETHWTQCQLPNGQWGYEPGSDGGRLSMTAAGIASLFVTHDWLTIAHYNGDVGRDPFSPALKKGLDWLEEGDHSVNLNVAPFWGYCLYGIERVGLASGFKYFGTHDWYRELARDAIEKQDPGGSWSSNGNSDALIETPYALLFLARGRHPILMNKLRFNGFWANRPRDLANLTVYASQEVEHPLNWQIVPLDNDWTDWLDSPILYLASHKPVSLTDQEYDKLRSFVQAGGLLFTQADGDSVAFDKFATELAARLFPAYPLADLPLTSPLYSTVFKLQAGPKVKAVSNGARLLMVHSPLDLARVWQTRQQYVNKIPYQFGVNLFVYAAGKRDWHNRLDSNYITAPEVQPSFTVHVARVRYNGNWDPEPYAWTRFSRWFERQTGYGLEVSTVNMGDLSPQDTPLAILTGTDNYAPSQAELLAVKNFVEQGGVLFIDMCGGQGAFEESVRTQLFAGAFPNVYPQNLSPDHPLVNKGPPGMEDLTRTRLRPYAIEKLGEGGRDFPFILQVGRGHVISTSLDVTSGLLGTATWGIIGYQPEYAQSLMKNLVLWTVDGQKD